MDAEKNSLSGQNIGFFYRKCVGAISYLFIPAIVTSGFLFGDG